MREINEKELNLEWQEFVGYYGSSDYSYITISPVKGTFYISANAMREIFKYSEIKSNEDLKSVEIAVDFENRFLVIRPLDTHTANSLSLAGGQDNNTARYFTNRNLRDRIKEMLIGSKGRYAAEWNENLNALVVDLDDCVQEFA